MLRFPPVSLLFAGTLAAAVARAASIEQSTSTSRQFIVYGTDLAMRGAICEFAEQTKRELLALLGQRDNWTAAIVIDAQYPRANLPELPKLRVEVGQTGFGLKLQLDFVVNAETRPPELRREVLRALLLEIMYRGRGDIPAGTTYNSPPDWLLDGVPAARSDLSRDQLGNLLALVARSGKILPLEKFVTQRPELLDAAGRTLYRAYSFALVDLLSHAPDGPLRLTRFITDLPSVSNDLMADLRAHFPGLLEATRQTWEKQIVRLSARQPYQLLGSAETEKILAEKLRIRFAERTPGKTYELEDYQDFLKSRSAKNVLDALTRELSALATRAHPIYAALIAEYAEISARLALGKTAGITRRLERLRKTRDAVTVQMRAIDDYLNWFEATSLDRPSRRFVDYMEAAERANRREQSRRDPISVYLDVLAAQFED
ncbi:MAG TPA: hypothetical protein VGW57_08210 [Chthoniobacterales bacterium]|nr:hypothetical protein [Chthoniobacterales bacterium]